MDNPGLWSVVVGVILLAVAFWPQRGLWWRLRGLRQRARHAMLEDALKHILDFQQRRIPVTAESLSGVLKVRRNRVVELLRDLENDGLIRFNQTAIILTPHGAETAFHVVRAHRLWETHLARETGYDETEWHRHAERQEHRLTAAEVDELAARLGHPLFDPHGDPIPNGAGHHTQAHGQALIQAQPGLSYRIVHVEDEPTVVYAQLVADGLHPGVTVTVLDKDDRRIRFLADGAEHRLAPMLAANLTVEALAEPAVEIPALSLDQLRPNEEARVVALSRACRGQERRRLMDLGILPGAAIEVEMNSPLGDPTAYRVRDTLIALRREQARLIQIEKVAQPA
ncbi:MAG: FeoA domain-containing protein [Caldilineaceae bacterium]|nr:FeoA domain-containing protein [Caldilineaceae bacterium]